MNASVSSPCAALWKHFDAPRRPSNLAAIVDDPSGCFRCEFDKVSCNSLSNPVLDGELLIRVVIAPKDRDKLDPLAPSEKCISSVGASGLSVLRAGVNADISDELERLAKFLVHSSASNISDEEVAECLGVIEFEARIAREIPSPQYILRHFGVYETPQVDYHSHADLLQAVNLWTSKTKSKIGALQFFEAIRPKFIAAADYTRADLKGIIEVGQLVR